MTRGRVAYAIGLLVVLVVLAAVLVRLLVWETVRPAPVAEGSGASLVVAAPRVAALRPV